MIRAIQIKITLNHKAKKSMDGNYIFNRGKEGIIELSPNYHQVAYFVTNDIYGEAFNIPEEIKTICLLNSVDAIEIKFKDPYRGEDLLIGPQYVFPGMEKKS